MTLQRLIHTLGACALAYQLVASPASARNFTARDLVMLDRLSDPQLSPDGSLVAYDLRKTDFAGNHATHSLWVIRTTPGAQPRMISSEGSGPRWSPDGSGVYFTSSRSGSAQVWRVGINGASATQVTHLPLDVQAFRIAPNGKRIVVALAVFPDCQTIACTVNRNTAVGKSKASGMLYTRLFIRHWDTWADGTRNHLFSQTLGAAGASGTVRSLMGSFDGDTPTKPFGGDEDFVISPDGASVVFVARLAGKSEPWSTNFDLYQVPIDGGSLKNLTAENKAEDIGPAFSPDGKWLAYTAMKRPTFESDRYGVIVRNMRTGEIREIDPSWDRSANSPAWSRDGKTIYVTADDLQTHKLFAINVAGGQVTALTHAGDVSSFQVGRTSIAYSANSLTSPDELFVAKAPNFAGVQISHVDAKQLNGITLSPSESYAFTGWNGDKVYGRVTKPYGYVAGKKYPIAFLIHGGPQGSWLDGWSYRWNPQFYAGLGYAVVTVDFHGSTGYGQAFTDAISQHWGDRPLEDLQKGWDAALQQFSYLDGNRACALGASYGGYMVYWIAGNWTQPWKCLVDHDGVFDNRFMGYATEELWFSEWENGGTPWENPAGYEQFNPINHVADWKVPMLVVHSQLDFRIPYSQGIAAFTALQRKGIPSEYLEFPNENHFVLKPQNSLQWHNTVADWLKRWI